MLPNEWQSADRVVRDLLLVVIPEANRLLVLHKLIAGRDGQPITSSNCYDKKITKYQKKKILSFFIIMV